MSQTSAVETTTAMKCAEEVWHLKIIKPPLASSSKERLTATIKKQKVKCKDLVSRLKICGRKFLLTVLTEIDKALEDDILTISGKNDMKSSPHMNLFWQQDKKCLASPAFG